MLKTDYHLYFRVCSDGSFSDKSAAPRSYSNTIIADVMECFLASIAERCHERAKQVKAKTKKKLARFAPETSEDACQKCRLGISHLSSRHSVDESFTISPALPATFAVSNSLTRLWGGSKGVINFPWIFFYAMRSLIPAGHFRNISGHLVTWLVSGSFQ